MVRRAKARFSEAVSAGRAIFREGNVEELPFEVSSFGKVCTVNTVYFWSSLDAGFAEIHRVLSPGGRVVVGFLPKERMDRMGMPTDIFTSRAPADVVAALTKAGFSDVRIERPEPTTPCSRPSGRMARRTSCRPASRSTATWSGFRSTM